MSKIADQPADTVATAEGLDDGMRFGFGSNWSDYINTHFSEERVENAQRHLLAFLKLENLSGLSFLDVGCGSGLHSLAAWRAGASSVVSFDYDPQSVETTRKLHRLVKEPENWQISQGSVLDGSYLTRQGNFEVVYSWGVLHHTGRMWEAFENAAQCLGDRGVFYVALYSKDNYVSPPYQYWLDIKREYNQAGLLKRRWMDLGYAWRSSIRPWLSEGKNPFAEIKAYKQSRGMSFWHDVRDWLGGYPMDFAGNKETENVAASLGLELINIKAGEGNTEFLFRKRGVKNYWDSIVERVPLQPIPGPFRHEEGFAWSAALPVDAGPPERLMLYENGSPVGWPHSCRYNISTWGKGRYWIEDGRLVFSTTNNLDPNESGANYAFRANFI